MIGRNHPIGTQVRFVGAPPGFHAEGVPYGEIGTITCVDEDDPEITYKVAFPSCPRQDRWWMNSKLEAFTSEPECGWKTRALKAEAELLEVKNALKALSEV